MLTIGLIGAILVGIAYFPEVFYCYRTKTRRMGKGTLLILLLGMVCWMCHALYRLDIILLFSNLISTCQLLYMLSFKRKSD